MISGNVGEWSEIYVLLRLLSDGFLRTVPENEETETSPMLPIIQIFRQENDNHIYRYVVKDLIEIYNNDELVKKMSRDIFGRYADFLFEEICRRESGGYVIPDVEDFMSEIGCFRLAAPSTDKTDIKMQLHDIRTGYRPICGFSIKSEISSPPTLLNASFATNFVFQLANNLSDDQIRHINNIETRQKITDRISAIYSLGNHLSFFKLQNQTFDDNLRMIDGQMPELLAEVVLVYYQSNVSKIKSIIEILERSNPLRFSKISFYSHKIKKFLYAVALGMTPSREWNGDDEANGGYIIVKNTGTIEAFYIFNKNAFEEYLLQNTKLDRGSTERHGFASIFKDDDNNFLINLNLQIRFL